MPRVVDIANQRFGRLFVVARHPENHRGGQAQWKCRCDCGGETVVCGFSLRSGSTRSCGCLNREQIKSVQPIGVANRRRHPSELSYNGAHDRVRAARGNAKDHACIDCARPAQEWSLRRDAPVTYMASAASGFICRISGDPADYEPRCCSCHRLYDAQTERGREDG